MRQGLQGCHVVVAEKYGRKGFQGSRVVRVSGVRAYHFLE